MDELVLSGDLPNDIQGQFIGLNKPLSFWGGINTDTGDILDPEQAASGCCAANKVLYVRALRGSTAGPGALLEWLNSEASPLAIISARFEPMIYSAFQMHRLLNGSGTSGYAYIDSQYILDIPIFGYANITNNRLTVA